MKEVAIPVVQLVEKNVEILSALEAALFGQQAVVRVVKGSREAPEHACYGQVKLVVAVEGGRIESH
jgi:hypothetical protein